MAGYMGVDSMRNDIASDLGWFWNPSYFGLFFYWHVFFVWPVFSVIQSVLQRFVIQSVYLFYRDLKTGKRISL